MISSVMRAIMKWSRYHRWCNGRDNYLRKLIEIRNDKNVRACDLVREDDDSLCYHMKCRDNKGNTRLTIRESQ